MAGLLLALYSFGSLVSGLVFGALNLQISLRRQLLFAVGGLAVVSAPLAVLPSLWATAVGLFLAGLAVAPSLISGMALIERIVPASRLSESMGWASSGIGLGLALSMPAAGYVSDHVRPHLAYLVLSGCAVGALLVALGVLPGLRRADKSALATDSDQPGVTAVPAEPMVVIDAPVPMPPLEEPGQPGTAAERW
nr:MFS transporter [Nakamurella aerolata]